MMESRPKIISNQLDFYREGLAGCKFAEYAAKNPKEHKWGHVVVESVSVQKLDDIVKKAISNPDVNQISLILPNIKSKLDLENLLKVLEKSEFFFFEEENEYDGYRCVRLRAKILGKTAWVSGFGPMDFLPKTRQSPYTELVFRVKDKKDYPKNIQAPTPTNELHVANLEVPSMSREVFNYSWKESFIGTNNILGHRADELSAAKTTFSIPK